MANIQSHMSQWVHNRSLLEHIPAKYPDWIVTVAFYTALQAVDALLAYDNVTAYSHDVRNTTLKQTNRYEHIWKHYYPLYDLSRKVRYLAAPAQWVKYQDIDKNVLRKYLYPIEKSVKTLTKETEWPSHHEIKLIVA